MHVTKNMWLKIVSEGGGGQEKYVHIFAVHVIDID